MNARLTKYIEFEQEDYKGKTKKWVFWNKKDGHICARVYWYGGWRKYVVELYGNGFYDWGFLRMLAEFSEQETLKQLGKL